MRPNRGIEIGTGLFVLLGFATLAFLTTQLPGSGMKISSASGYTVTARFDNIGDLRSGAPVSMAGVRIGRVDSVGYDSREFKAIVSLTIEDQFNQIPDDSSASIQTAGLLGAKYIGIDPGGSETNLKAGSQIVKTNPALVLENLIHDLFASFTKGNSSNASQESPQGTTQESK